MRETFYFYDLETSGLNPRTDRIMQFAGQRTDLDFRPIGEPTNLLIELCDDTLPSPGAIMVTGITPQSTHQDGISEREFCRFLINEVATPGTTIMGYNSIRFDDEFIRNTLWRNFYDSYEWQWKDRRSRWDLLDVVRLTRALRPEGIEWPVNDEGVATNRLELITKCNQISHEHAHDALADVIALIEVTKLIKQKQPQMFNYLYTMRSKPALRRLVNLKSPQPFVYASGRFSADFQKTTVAYPIAEARNGNLLVFNLRYNLEDLLAAEADGTFAEKYGRKPWPGQKIAPKSDSQKAEFFPIVKTLQYNHCPAVAPLGVLDKDHGWEKIGLTKDTIRQHLQILGRHPEFIQRMIVEQGERAAYPRAVDPESALYNGFIDEQDKLLCSAVRSGSEDLADFHPNFSDERLPELLLHYKAKNFPQTLSSDEVSKWEEYRNSRLGAQAPKFIAELKKIQQDLAANRPFAGKSLDECTFLVEELMLWYQSILPGEY